jgi:hypothetical protein
MIAEMRTYMVKPGNVQEYIKAYAQLGRATQIKHLGHPIGYFTAEVGGLNKIIHLWGYASLAERETKRASLEADPIWREYLKHRTDAGLLFQQENVLLKAVDFPALAVELESDREHEITRVPHSAISCST